VARPHRFAALLGGLDRVLAGCVRAGRWLALAVALLLFLQWPLREWIQAYSREANDLAQVLFALYVALAVSAATRERTHLAVDAFATRRSARARGRLGRAAAGLVLLPAACALLAASAGPVYRSARVLEAFPETYNPGYFVLKLALIVLTVGVLLQALLDALRPADGEG